MHWHAVGAWLYANVLGNLVASAVTTATGLAWHHRRMKRHVTAEMLRLRLHAAHDRDAQHRAAPTGGTTP